MHESNINIAESCVYHTTSGWLAATCDVLSCVVHIRPTAYWQLSWLITSDEVVAIFYSIITLLLPEMDYVIWFIYYMKLYTVDIY